MPEDEAIVNWLERAIADRYAPIVAFSVKSERTGQSGEAAEAVYFVRLANGRSLYVRTLSDARVEPTKRALSVTEDIGIPDSEVIDGDPPLLVMEPARGRPLSQLLPIFFLPGAWLYEGNRLCDAANTVGRCLGHLHAGTVTAMRTPATVTPYDRYTGYSDEFYDHLGDQNGDALDQVVAAAMAIETPLSCVSGDPTPHNLFYSSGRIEVIDNSFIENLAITDLVMFERGLELMAGRLPYGRQSQARMMIGAFRDGYEHTGPDLGLDNHYRSFKLIDYGYVLNRYLTGELKTDKVSVQQLIKWADVNVCTRRIRQLLRECADSQ